MNEFGIRFIGVKMKVFVNGSFDVLHTGHLDLLNYAKSLGDFLHVAIDSDRRISEKKGAERPFNLQHNRKMLMENLKAVNKVSVFDSDDELINIVREYVPDVMLVGSDWQSKTIIGSQYAKSMIYFDRINDESTTKTIERYLDRRQLHR
jgi:D-beta-D-heptose 7-phosphate kinase/D-beta-D-heptose 1-phosphate adenosyltransferase